MNCNKFFFVFSFSLFSQYKPLTEENHYLGVCQHSTDYCGINDSRIFRHVNRNVINLIVARVTNNRKAKQLIDSNNNINLI